MQTKCLSITRGDKLLYRPQPKQLLFHLSKASEVLYGGAAGGGKSHAILWDAYMNCVQNPGIRVLILRRTYPELEKSHIFKSRGMFSEDMGKYTESKKRWEIYTDSESSYIEFGHCKDEGDVFGYQSAEYEIIYVDELTHFTEFMYLYFRSRLRTSNQLGFRCQMKCATNPGNIGHAWVRKRWKLYDSSTWFKEWKPEMSIDEPNPGSRNFIQARLDDNKILMEASPDYVNNLRSLPENERKQLLDGDWEVFSGQAFSEWAPEHICKPFQIPKDWDRWISIDFGYSKPFSAQWHTQDPISKRFYTYRELYGAGIRDVVQAQKVLEMSVHEDGTKEKISFVVADPSIWAKKGSGMSTAEIYAANGLYCIPASNERIQGKIRLHDYLSKAPDGLPWWRIFEGRCPALVKTLPELILDRNRPEDVNTTQEDHAYDSVRYFFMTRPTVKNREIDTSSKALDPSSRMEWEHVRRMFLKNSDSGKAIGHGITQVNP